MTTYAMPLSGNFSGNLTSSLPHKCQSRRVAAFLVFAILPSVSIVINGSVLVALMTYRRKLRQNNVYLHVANTLLTNVIFSMLAFYQILNLYFDLDGYGHFDPNHQGLVREDVRVWWAFYRALLTAMFLIMCGNIGILVSSIRDTTHAPLLFGSRALELKSKSASERDEGRKLAKLLAGFDRKRRQRRAWILIATVWIFPLLYVVSAPLGWSCAYSCICLSGCYPYHELDSLKTRICSRVWPPMRHDWLVVGIGLWAVSVAVVVAILWRTLSDTKRHFRYCRIRVDRGITSPQLWNTLVTTKAPDVPVSTKLSESDDVARPTSDVKATRHRSLLRSHQVLRRTLGSLRYLIWITVLFVTSTAPAMGLMLIDYLSDTNPSMVLGNGCLCVPFAYCLVCPFLLAKCLPGIRQAFVALALKCGSCGGDGKSRKRKTGARKSSR